MKYRLIIPLLAAVMLLFSCAEEQLKNDTSTKDYLVFDVENVETRGQSTTTASIREFGVFCFDTEQSKWETVKTTATPNKMYNQQVLYSNGEWSYNPPAYWENYENKFHTFFAYSPLAKGMLVDNNTDSNNINLITTESTPGVPKLQFELLNDISAQVDLLVAKEHFDLKPEVVKMQFRHVLSRIGFKAFCETAGTYVQKIEFIDIPYKGELEMSSTAIWSVDAATSTFTLDYGNGVPVLATEDNPTDISAPGRYLMAIPNTWTNNNTAKVKIYYSQEDVSIEKEFIIGSTNEIWHSNKSVTYLLDLNSTPNNDLIVEKVIIDDWTMGSIIDSDVNLKGENHWLRFDGSGATASIPTDIELESGTLYKIPNTTPVKSGETFVNWNTAQDGSGTPYTIGQRVPIVDADVTLYAQFQ